MIKTILRNLISNAIKFSHKNGKVEVGAKLINDSKEKGTGLGLFLCKEFIKKHGGAIWVESELGKVSTLKFTL